MLYAMVCYGMVWYDMVLCGPCSLLALVYILFTIAPDSHYGCSVVIRTDICMTV